MQRTLQIISFMLCCYASMVGLAAAEIYDLVIHNGRVMDPETTFDSVSNVGIKAGRIAVITKDKIMGKEVIDATGLVVAPGFIDTHFHSVDRYATKLAVADGITTGMDLEAGATRVGEWYAKKNIEGWQVNYGTTSSMLSTRLLVHDPEVNVNEPIDAATADNTSRNQVRTEYRVTRSLGAMSIK